jgi:hypothetical protein
MKKENGKAKEKVKDKSGPVVDPAAAQQLNMMVLKRYDADIEEVCNLVSLVWLCAHHTKTHTNRVGTCQLSACHYVHTECRHEAMGACLQQPQCSEQQPNPNLLLL